MRINRLALNGFRNYDFETVSFSPATNVIYGANAQGKTNLLEAVYLLSCGRSFRTRFDRELLGFGNDFCEILADIESGGREQTVRIVIKQGVRKQISVNGVKKTASELSETLKTVLFCPDDLNIIKDGAAARRRLMDNAISQIRPRYAEYLTQFNKFYENKTRILKDWHEKPSLLDTLDEEATDDVLDGEGSRRSLYGTGRRSSQGSPRKRRPYTASFPQRMRSSVLSTGRSRRCVTRSAASERFTTTSATIRKSIGRRSFRASSV